MQPDQLVGGEEQRRPDALELQRTVLLSVDRPPHPLGGDHKEGQEADQHHRGEYRQAPERGPPALAPPHVHQRDRQDHDRIRLGRRTQAEQHESAPLAVEVERRQGGDRQHRREQVVAGEEHRSEQHRREGDQRHAARQLPVAHPLRAEHERGQAGGDHAARGHHQLEHGHVAREAVAGEQARKNEDGQRQRRVLDREVAIGEQPTAHDVVRVFEVLVGVPLAVERVPAVMDQVPRDHEADRRPRHCQRGALPVRGD